MWALMSSITSQAAEQPTPFGQSRVEGLILALKQIVGARLGMNRLRVENDVDAAANLRIEGLAGPAHHRDLQRLAHEARLVHPIRIDSDDPGAAAGPDFDQFGMGERDQGLTDRLSGNPVAVGQILFGKRHSG